MAKVEAAPHLRQQLLLPPTDVPTVPTPDVIRTYKRKEAQGKRKKIRAAEKLESQSSLIDPGASVLASTPEGLWPITRSGDWRLFKNISHRRERSGEESKQESARKETFKLTQAKAIQDTALAYANAYARYAASLEQRTASKEAQSLNPAETHAYRAAQLVNDLASNPMGVLTNRIEGMRQNIHPSVREAFNLLGKVIPGKDPFEMFYGALENNDQLQGLAEWVKNMATSYKQTVATDYPIHLVEEAHLATNPTAAKVHTAKEHAISSVAGFAERHATGLITTALATIAPEAALGEVMIMPIVKRLLDEPTKRFVGITTDVVSELAKGHGISKASLPVMELILSLIDPSITFDAQTKNLFPGMVFAENARQNTEMAASALTPYIELKLYDVAKSGDKAVADAAEKGGLFAGRRVREVKTNADAAFAKVVRRPQT